MTSPDMSSDFFLFLAFLPSRRLEARLKLRFEGYRVELLDADFKHVRPYLRFMNAALTASAAVVIQTVSSRN